MKQHKPPRNKNDDATGKRTAPAARAESADLSDDSRSEEKFLYKKSGKPNQPPVAAWHANPVKKSAPPPSSPHKQQRNTTRRSTETPRTPRRGDAKSSPPSSPHRQQRNTTRRSAEAPRTPRRGNTKSSPPSSPHKQQRNTTRRTTETPRRDKPTAPLSSSAREEKIHKILADSGIGSRRQMETVITEGRVTVNGKTATLGARAQLNARICIDGKPLGAAQRRQRILLYNKPIGKIVSRTEVDDTVFSDLPPLTNSRWINVGRLDVNSEGLLLFSTDGGWVERMAHPRNRVEREYRVRASGKLEQATLLAACRKGVPIDNSNPIYPRCFILEHEGDGINCWYRIVLTEGRNRAVRRLMEYYDLQVSRLIRIRYGDYQLPAELQPGDWHEISNKPPQKK